MICTVSYFSFLHWGTYILSYILRYTIEEIELVKQVFNTIFVRNNNDVFQSSFQLGKSVYVFINKFNILINLIYFDR